MRLKPRDFRAEFCALFRQSGLTQYGLARLSGVAQPVISRYLSGRVLDPSSVVLGRLWPHLERAVRRRKNT